MLNEFFPQRTKQFNLRETTNNLRESGFLLKNFIREKLRAKLIPHNSQRTELQTSLFWSELAFHYRTSKREAR